MTDGPAPSAPSISIATGLRLLAPFARHGASSYAASAVFSAIGTLCQLVPFWVAYRFVDELVTDSPTRGELYRLSWIAVAAIAIMTASLGASTFLSHRAAFATLEQLRLRVGERLGRVPLGFITSRRAGDMQRTMNDDVERLELFLAHAVPDLISGVVVLAATTVWMFTVDWRMAIATGSVVVIGVPLMSFGVRRGSAKLGMYMSSMGRMNGSIVEFVRGLPVVRAFNRADDTFAETRSAIEDAATFEAQWGREFVPLFTAFYTVLVANVVTVLPVGVWLWHRDSLSSTDLLFFFIVGLGYSAPVLKLMEFTTQVGYLSLGAGMVLELDGATELPEVHERAGLGSPSVEFESVSFSHRDREGSAREVLHDVSFLAPAGSLTAFVGPSGSGKSTIARLICRFWDVDQGTVRVGGVDVRAMPFEQLMDHVAFVFQDSFLFDDTIGANIRMGRPSASDVDVEAAARAAQAHDFIARLPQGYQTKVGERGARLSGGERQRVAIARAILKDAPIVVLDEATSFADPENEAALQDALGELVRGRTLIMIAHRLSTIVGAHQILVLDDGQIVQRGTHAELVASDGLYALLWTSFEQAGEVALGHAVRAGAAAVTA